MWILFPRYPSQSTNTPPQPLARLPDVLILHPPHARASVETWVQVKRFSKKTPLTSWIVKLPDRQIWLTQLPLSRTAQTTEASLSKAKMEKKVMPLKKTKSGEDEVPIKTEPKIETRNKKEPKPE